MITANNTSVTWNLQPFHGFGVGGFKHRHHKARNHCACHAKRIVSEPLQIPHACQRFCNPHELLRLPRILQRVEIPAPATRNTLWTSKNVPRPSVFNDFDFQIVLARRRGANFAKLNFQKCSEPLSFERFWLPNRSRAQAWCKFYEAQLQKVVRACQFFEIKWVGCQLIWDSSDLDVKWFEVQVIWLSIDLRLNELVVNWFEIQVIRM